MALPLDSALITIEVGPHLWRELVVEKTRGWPERVSGELRVKPLDFKDDSGQKVTPYNPILRN
jgi:hypothetical protein